MQGCVASRCATDRKIDCNKSSHALQNRESEDGDL